MRRMPHLAFAGAPRVESIRPEPQNKRQGPLLANAPSGLARKAPTLSQNGHHRGRLCSPTR